MRIYPPSIGQIEEVIYRWAQHKTGVSILRSDKKILEIVLLFHEQEEVVSEEVLRRYVFKENWDPECIQVTEEEKKVTIRLYPFGQ